MSSVTESNLEKKFQYVSNTQDSIQSFSLWILHHKSHCKKIVDVWVKTMRKTKVSHRLTLFYLANDVIQNSKRKGAAQFAETFQTVLPEVTVLLRDDKIRGSVDRVFNIWENRSVYTSDSINELKRILHNIEETNNATSKVISEFKPELLSERIRKTVKLQLETTSKLSALNGSKLDAANSEVLRQFKDRSHGQQFSRDFEEATRCLEEYIGALEKEVAERTETIQLLEQAVIYYDTQRGEARIVGNAYKSFSSRITIQKKKLEGLKALLPSPFPSPCPDAPSPTNSDEGLDLATEAAAAAPIVADADDDAPSPVGTPEGLQLSPKTDHNSTAEVNMTSEELKLTPPMVTSSTSMPVTSFLGSHGAGLMSSWLDAFSTPQLSNENDLKSAIDNKTEDSLDSRLDSRLLNLMQSIPSSVPSALLAGVGGETPVKDEWASAQGTPVQDEDEPPQNDLLKHLSRYSTNSPSQGQWPSALPPNPLPGETSLPGLKDDPFEIKPLLPPPKPSFACLGLLSSPPVSSSSKGKGDPRLTSQNYASTSSNNIHNSVTTITTATSKTSTALATTNSESTAASGHTGRDDIEPMDMDIGESDDDEEKSTKLECKTNAKVIGDDSPTVGNHTMHTKDSLHIEDQSSKAENVSEEENKIRGILETTEKPASYSTYRHFSYNRMTESRLPDNIMTDDDLPESRLSDNVMTDDCLSESRTSDDRMADNTPSEKSISESRLAENRLSENRTPDVRVAETRTSDNRILQNRITGGRNPEDVNENRMIETVMHNERIVERLPDSRIHDNRIGENNKSSGTWKTEEVECSRIETIQSTRNDDWRSPTWDDGPPASYNYRPPQQHTHYRPHMQHFDDRRSYDRPYNELGYGRGYPPPSMAGGPKRFPTPFGGRGGRGYFVPRY